MPCMDFQALHWRKCPTVHAVALLCDEWKGTYVCRSIELYVHWHIHGTSIPASSWWLWPLTLLLLS